ncbi:MAG: hypothetical protein Q8M03_11450 [Legionella sp.]|nr:hypothetical protein [Legionella sp.]
MTASLPLSQPSDTLLSHPSDTHNEPQAITLKARDGQMVELRASHLEHWFASIEKNTRGNEHNTDGQEHLTSQLLSRYGLRTAMDVIKFFHTPAGETVKKMMEEKLAEIVAMEDFQYQQMLDEQTRHNRAMAFLLLGLLYKKDARAKHLNESIQQQIDTRLHQAEKAQSAPIKDTDNLTKQLEAFDASTKAIQAALSGKQNDLAAFTRELASIAKQGIAIGMRYQTFEESLKELEVFHEMVLEPTTDFKKATANIESKIQGIEEALIKQVDEIQVLIVANKDEEAHTLGIKHQGLHLQVGGLKDMLDVIHHKKFLFDAEGEPCHSFKDAAFILTPDLKVVKDANNVHYLIGVTQNISALDDPESRQHAKNRFDKLQPEISVVENLVKHNYKLEKDFHNDRLKSAEKRGVTPDAVSKLHAEITLLGNQLAQIKAAQSNVIAEMNKPVPDVQKAQGMQSATPSNTPSANKAPVYTVETCKLALQAMENNPTSTTIQNVITNVTNVYGQNGNDVISALGKIKAGVRIPAATMRFLERSIDRLGLPADKLTSSITPEPDNGVKISPFNTTPSPFRK